MRVPRHAALAGLLAATGCAGRTLQWPETALQDPSPTGPRYLRLYKESHFRALGDRFRAGLTTSEFFDRLGAADVLFLGDHHADDTLHARMLALLEELDRRGRPYHLGLECIGTQDEAIVDEFVQGRIDLDQLVRAVHARWPETWLQRDDLDGSFYRELLRRTRQDRRPAFALEPTPRLPLYERDQAMARTVRDRVRKHAKALIVVVVGETHLLGHGQLVQRVAMPHVTVCASLSVALRADAARMQFSPGHRFAVTTSDVLFFLPLDDASSD